MDPTTEHDRSSVLRCPAGAVCLGVVFGALLAFTPMSAALELQTRGSVELEPCPVPGTEDEMLCGTFDVFENRDTRKGRVISLEIAVIPALDTNPRPDPIFWLAGGPGGAATAAAAWFQASWMRSERDVVLVDLRGTGGSNPLACQIPEDTEDLQNYLRGSFEDLGALRRCKRQLKQVANLRMYTTPNAIDDLDDVRAAMGYGRINIYAGSWGTRNTLIYLRRHPGRVRRAILNGAAPLALIYPLHIPDGAQRTLDVIFDQCARDADCAAAYPGLDQEFQAVLDGLAQAPEPVTIEHPDTGEPVVVELSHTAFGEAVRYLMRNRYDTRWVPQMVHQAYAGDFQPIAQFAVARNRFFSERLKLGLLLSVVCPEDVARIDPADIPRLTGDTFMGDVRVRQMTAACEIWPSVTMPETFGDPVESDVPVLIWSGTVDSALPPKWGTETVRHLANGLHLVVADGHGVSGPCYESINQRFLNRAKVSGMNTDCTEAMRLPPFQLPE